MKITLQKSTLTTRASGTGRLLLRRLRLIHIRTCRWERDLLQLLSLSITHRGEQLSRPSSRFNTTIPRFSYRAPRSRDLNSFCRRELLDLHLSPWRMRETNIRHTLTDFSPLQPEQRSSISQNSTPLRAMRTKRWSLSGIALRKVIGSTCTSALIRPGKVTDSWQTTTNILLFSRERAGSWISQISTNGSKAQETSRSKVCSHDVI